MTRSALSGLAALFAAGFLLCRPAQAEEFYFVCGMTQDIQAKLVAAGDRNTALLELHIGFDTVANTAFSWPSSALLNDARMMEEHPFPATITAAQVTWTRPGENDQGTATASFDRATGHLATTGADGVTTWECEKSE